MRGVGWGVQASLQHTVAVGFSKLFPQGSGARLLKVVGSGQHYSSTNSAVISQSKNELKGPIICSIGNVKYSRAFSTRNRTIAHEMRTSVQADT
jgi:hypothetical protein